MHASPEPHPPAKLHKCDHCGKVHTQTCRLKEHVRSHTSEKPYECNFYGQNFGRSGRSPAADAPIRKKTRTPGSCRPSGTARRSSRKCVPALHGRTHTGDKPHARVVQTLQYCGKKFTQAGARTAHGRTRTGEKPHKCSYCGQGFARNESLAKHARTHTKEKPYGCRHCGKKFALSASRTAHERVHTGEKPYICPYCSRAFARKDTLVAHERTHTGERPYGCRHCGKKFAQRPTRAAHERTHTGEKPHSCRHCGKKFTQAGARTTHERLHEELGPDPGANFELPSWAHTSAPAGVGGAWEHI